MSPILWLLLTAVAVLGDVIPTPNAPRPLEVVDANTDSSSLLFLFRFHVDSPINRGGVINVVFPTQLTLKTAPSCTVRQIRELAADCSYGSQLLQVTTGDFIARNSTLELRAYFPESPSFTGGTQPFSIYTQNYTNGQPQDIDFSFGQVAFLPSPVLMNTELATLQVDSKVVNATTDYTLRFVTAAEIYAGNEFRLTFPSSAWPGVTSNGPCTVTGVTYPVLGTFTCSKDPYTSLPSVRITGLQNDLPKGTTLTLKFRSIANPVCKVTNQANAILDVVSGGTYAVKQRLSFPLFTLTTGILKGVTQTPYNQYAAFFVNNKVLSLLEFTTVTGIPVNGKISIDFKVINKVTSAGSYVGCFLKSDSFFANGATPDCTLDTALGTASITGLPASPPGTTFQIVIQLQLDTATISAPLIQTLDGTCVIDENSNQLGSIIPSSAASVIPNPYPSYTITTGKSTMSVSFVLSTTADFNIGQIVYNLPPNWRPYPAERIYCTYSITDTTSGTTSYNIAQELCVYDLVENTLTWTPVQAVKLTQGYTLGLSFAHRLTNPKEVYSWRPLVASSLSTYHEFVLRIYDSAQTLTYAHHNLANVLPYNAQLFTFTAPSNFPSTLYAPVTFTPQPFFDFTPTDNRMEPFIELRFKLKSQSGTVDTWTNTLGHTDVTEKIPCSLVLPLQSLSTVKSAYCMRYAVVDTSYVPVRVWNIGPLRRYSSATLKVLVQGPSNVAADVEIHGGYGYLLNGKYYNYQQMDVKVNNLGLTASSSGTLTLRERISGSLMCQQETYFTMGVETVTGASSKTLILNFPGGWWTQSSPTLQGSQGTCATSTLYLSSYASVLECTSFSIATSDFFQVKTRNPDYTNQGTGAVRLFLLTSGDYFVTGATALATCTAPTTITTSISSIPIYFSSPGAKLTIDINLPGTYTSQDSLLITMKSGGYGSVTSCTPGSNFASCQVVSAKNGSGTFFVKMNAGNIKDLGRVEIGGVLLPASGALTYNLAVCKGTDSACTNKNSLSSDTSFSLSSSFSFPGDLLIGKLELTPNNWSTDSHLHIQMVANREIPDRSVITLTGNFVWPDVGVFNYICSHQYRSVTVSTNAMTMTVGKRIRAGELIELETYYVNLGGNTGTNTWITVTGSVTYYDFVFLNSPSLPDPTQLHPQPNSLLPYPSANSLISITGVTQDYLNAGERASYGFTISNTATTADARPVEWVRIRFPEEFKLRKEETECRMGDVEVECTVMTDYRSVLIPYSSAPLATTPFHISIHNVLNPGVSTTSTGFTVATLYNQTLNSESKATTTTLGITTPPAILDLMVLNKTTMYVRETATYTVLARSYAAIPTAYYWTSRFTEMNMTFSDDWRLQGLTINSTGHNWTFPGTLQGELTPLTLPTTNDDTNHINLGLAEAWLTYSPSPIVFTLGGVINPNEPGYSSPILSSIYSLTNKTVIAKTYPHLSQAIVTSTVNEGFRLITPQEVTLVVGTSRYISVATAGYFYPAREDLKVRGKTSSVLLKLDKSEMTIAQGEFEGGFLLSAGVTMEPGTYFVYWTVSGDSEELRYERLPTLKVTVIPSQISVLLQPIPQLLSNSTSLPFLITLSQSPESNLTLTLTPSENVTVSQDTINFSVGDLSHTYTISTAENSVGFWGSVSFALSGTDASIYWLPVSTLSFSIREPDYTEPEFVSVKVASPRQAHSVRIDVRSSLPAYLHTIIQESGLTPPSVSDLLDSDMVDVTTGKEMVVGRRYEELTAGRGYDWYGLLVSENRVESEVYKVTAYLPEKDNAVDFTISIAGPTPTDQYLVTVFQPWVASVLSVPTCWLQILSVQRDTSGSGVHTISLRLFSQTNSDRLSPLETIQSLSSPEYLSVALKEYTVTSFASEYQEYAVESPSWSEYPRLFNGNSSMVQVIFTPAVDGTVYASAYIKGIMRPSALDVKWGRTGIREPAEYAAWMEVKAGEVTVLSLSGLEPLPRYVVYLVLQGERSDEAVLTEPVPLAIPDYAYSYQNELSEDDDIASLLALFPALLSLSLF